MLLQYIKDKRLGILLFCVFALIFAVVFFFYGLPVAAVGYGVLLCLIFLLVVFLFDFRATYKKRVALARLKGNIIHGIDELPQPHGQIEADYAILLQEAEAAVQQLVFQSDAEKSEMLDFYTLWVHQIKTPIAAISVLLQEEALPQGGKLSQELFKIERYAELVLGYLRLGSISSDLQLERYSLEALVKQAVKKYAPLFIQKKIALEMNGLQEDVLTDEKWLVFVLEQLLSNALKYTETGTIRIYTEEGQILVIEDTGIGIAPEDQPRLFERGFTGFNGRLDQKATGLGLYLCKKTLKKLRHPIWISSKRGTGTAVRIDLSADDIKPE